MQQASVWKVTARFGEGWVGRLETIHIAASSEDEAIELGVMVLQQQIPHKEWTTPRVSADCVMRDVFVEAV